MEVETFPPFPHQRLITNTRLSLSCQYSRLRWLLPTCRPKANPQTYHRFPNVRSILEITQLLQRSRQFTFSPDSYSGGGSPKSKYSLEGKEETRLSGIDYLTLRPTD